jgi:hypothetical protein
VLLQSRQENEFVNLTTDNHPITESAPNEFWFHVADQSEIPIAGEIDRSFDLAQLIEVLSGLPDEAVGLRDYLAPILARDIDFIDVLRTLVGVSDKRMYLELSYKFGKTPSANDPRMGVSGDSFYNLNRHPLSFFKNLSKVANKTKADEARYLILDYLLAKNLAQIMYSMKAIGENGLSAIVDALIITKEVQQKQAKRRGHGAEYELAKFLHELGVSMIPIDRHSRPMGSQDPNVDRKSFELSKKIKGQTWSFDLILPNPESNVPQIFIQGLIHTSDPGQYGVNKSDETLLIKEELEACNKKGGPVRELWGLVDGVGFSENKSDTIDKMLVAFDCFVQLKSLYKAALRLHSLGFIEVKAIKFDDSAYTADEQAAMFAEYGDDEIAVLQPDDVADNSWKSVQGGCATIYV